MLGIGHIPAERSQSPSPMHPPSSQQGSPGAPHAVHVPASSPQALPAMHAVATPPAYVMHTPPSAQSPSKQQGWPTWSQSAVHIPFVSQASFEPSQRPPTTSPPGQHGSPAAPQGKHRLAPVPASRQAALGSLHDGPFQSPVLRHA
jgi:hypothetical protein